MHKEKILAYCFLVGIVILAGCNSEDSSTGRSIAGEKTAYDVLKEIDLQAESQKIENKSETGDNEIEKQIKANEEPSNMSLEAEFNETSVNVTGINEAEEENSNDSNSILIADELSKKAEEFKFDYFSTVNTQNNISISIDNIKHEIKSEYWGKIIEISMTILNKGNTSFKPKVLVLLYDEKDFKEDWLKPKAEINFDINQLNAGDHTTRQAIVNIAFDDINLTKAFKLVLVDAADPGNKPLVVVEKEFNALPLY
ncbi:MAG: hypothetical protein AABX33_01215 [Nanoarchaeota archaeon]